MKYKEFTTKEKKDPAKDFYEFVMPEEEEVTSNLNTVLLLLGVIVVCLFVVKGCSILCFKFKEAINKFVLEQKQEMFFNGIIRGISLSYLSISF